LIDEYIEWSVMMKMMTMGNTRNVKMVMMEEAKEVWYLITPLSL